MYVNKDGCFMIPLLFLYINIIKLLYHNCVVPSPAIGVNVSTSGSVIIESELNLTCVVFELISGLTQSPMATWTTTTSIPGSIETTTTTDRTVAVLNINPLRASHPVTYTCQGSIFTPVGSRTQMIQESIMIRPQSKYC